MSIAEKRKQKSEEMQQHILDAAKDVAAADGWQNLTIRKICGKIEYTAPVVYQYFESKDKLMEALRNEGLQQIYTLLEAVDKKHKSQEKRLVEYGLAWWHFSLQHAEIYQVMYNLQGALCVQNPNTSGNLLDFYHEAFSAICDEAKHSLKFRLELCDNFIALIHGFISIRMVNKIKSGNENAETVFKKAILRFIKSLN